MDWSKAKSVLILVFIILNIFLAYNIMLLYNDEGISAHIIENVENILMDNGVELKCQIPVNVDGSVYGIDETYKGVVVLADELIIDGIIPRIEYKGQKEEVEIIYEKLPEDLVGENIDYAKEVRRILKKIKLPMDELFLDRQLIPERKGRIELKYVEKKDNMLFFDNVLNIIIENGKMYMKITYKKYKHLSNSNSNVVPAYQILLRNFHKDKKVFIESIDIGVKFCDVDRNYTGPFTVWRIKMDDGDKFFIVSTGDNVN